ncbi:hypothetical protein P0082_08835 [Candidatus Haliotispira prima]|uniref:Uncharacterized protein n=1 Tax=Candidatus Haliotispira prima TaxID=3034016 RepID=A0ABY8MF36_9SPIO|nr:hypothetical protein P0082_08835 [Candidatus Haliotispira prima]
MEYIQKGGIISIVLLVTLFITLSLALERCIYFWLTRTKKTHSKPDTASNSTADVSEKKSIHSQSARIAGLVSKTAYLPPAVRKDVLEKEG